MTCHSVRLEPSLCTCGVELDITQWHGDNELGDPLCPTCSGCGCEPNERNLMNEQELDALPIGAAVLGPITSHRLEVFTKRMQGVWSAPRRFDMSDEEIAEVPLTLLHPVPEPDHSMCARLVPYDTAGDGRRRFTLQNPDGTRGGILYEWFARERGYAIPEPEPSLTAPTVMDRTAEVMAQAIRDGEDPVQALDRAGLLVRDGEQ